MNLPMREAADRPQRLGRRALEATDHGRSQGWDIELAAGEVIARLDEPRYEDMFWVSYRLTPTTDDAALASRLLSREFWRSDAANALVYRSRALGLIAPHAFASIEPFVAPARLNMRGLYLRPEDGLQTSADSPKAATAAPPRPAGRLVRVLGLFTGCLGSKR